MSSSITTPSDDEGLREELWEVFESREKTDADHMLINIMDKLVPYISQKIIEARVDELNALDRSEIANSSIKKMQVRIKGRIVTLTTKQDTKEK